MSAVLVCVPDVLGNSNSEFRTSRVPKGDYLTISSDWTANTPKWFCCCSVTKLCPTVCNSMDCNMPCLPLLPEFAQNPIH